MDRIYISGKMSGLTDTGIHAAFDPIADRFRATGHKVYNPADHLEEFRRHRYTYEHIMELDIQELLTCGIVIMLPTWRDSKGATLEHHIARVLGKFVVYE